MSKACGVTGPMHSGIAKDAKTASGAKSALRDVFPTGTEQVKFTVMDSVEEIDDAGKKRTKKVAREVERNVKDAVRDYVIADNNAKAAKEQADEAALALRTFIGPIRDENAEQGDFHLSFRVNGAAARSGQVYAAQVSAQNRFSVPKKDKDIDALREAVGKVFFNEHFEREVTIAIRKEIMDNAAKRRELSKILIDALGADKMKEYFKKDELWVAKKSLLEGQYDLEADEREKLRTQCKPYADAVKNVSYNPKDRD